MFLKILWLLVASNRYDILLILDRTADDGIAHILAASKFFRNS